jgi:hypothetical protein
MRESGQGAHSEEQRAYTCTRHDDLADKKCSRSKPDTDDQQPTTERGRVRETAIGGPRGGRINLVIDHQQLRCGGRIIERGPLQWRLPSAMAKPGKPRGRGHGWPGIVPRPSPCWTAFIAGKMCEQGVKMTPDFNPCILAT